MNFRLTKDATMQALVLGSAAVAIGLYMSWPLQLDYKATIAALITPPDKWWDLLVLFLAFAVTALTLAIKKYIALAECVGMMAFMVLLCPLLSVYAALPSGLGGITALLFFGGMTIIIALSALMSLAALKRYRR